VEVSYKLDYNVLINYLKIRGLPTDPVTLSKSGIEFAGAQRCREALGLKEDHSDKRLGIIYHYPNSDYCNVRWFGKYIGPFGSIIDRKGDAPPGRSPISYLSPLNDWTAFDGEDLYLCESVLKALVVSTTGRYAIAGSGVWGLCPKDQLLLPEELRGRAKKVVILFDNDWPRNANVRAAIRRLGNRVKQRWPGVEVLHGQIPNPPTGSYYWDVERGKDAGKWGIDDCIATMGWPEIKEEQIEPTERELALDEFNEKYAVCAHPPCIIAIGTGHKYSRADFIGLLESHRKLWDSEKPVELSKLWLTYEDRTMVPKVDYIPGGERIVRGEYYNEWQDDGVAAQQGDITPFLKVYENAIPDSESRTLLFQSFAWILQNRGVKLDKAFIFVGRQVGTGKSLLAKTFGLCLGQSNYAAIGLEDFSSDFNSAFAAKELVLVDDLQRMGSKEVAKLKRYVTADKIVVNAKNVKQYEIKNTAVFVITTNEYSAVAMDDVERRNLVVEFDPIQHYPTGSQWWTDYVDWLEAGGYGIIRWWLEHMDLTGFDPAYMPPMSKVKKKMIEMGRDDMLNWVAALRENPDNVLGQNQRSVYSTQEIYFLYAGADARPGELQKMGHALGNYFDKVAGGLRTRWWTGGQVGCLWAIREPDREWTEEEARENVAKYRQVGLPT
jgi:hypothetical protein